MRKGERGRAEERGRGARQLENFQARKGVSGRWGRGCSCTWRQGTGGLILGVHDGGEDNGEGVEGKVRREARVA